MTTLVSFGKGNTTEKYVQFEIVMKSLGWLVMFVMECNELDIWSRLHEWEDGVFCDYHTVMFAGLFDGVVHCGFVAAYGLSRREWAVQYGSIIESYGKEILSMLLRTSDVG